MLEPLHRVVVADVNGIELFAHKGKLRRLPEEVEDQARKDLAHRIAGGWISIRVDE